MEARCAEIERDKPVRARTEAGLARRLREQGPDREVYFRSLVDAIRDRAIFMLDLSGHVATWSLGAERLEGYTADEIIGRHFSIFYPKEDVAAGKCEHDLMMVAREGRFEGEGWRLRRDGSRFWAAVVISAARDEKGRLLGFWTVAREATERKRSGAEPFDRVAEERFRLFIESVRDYAMFMLDPSGHVETWNLGAERIKGYRAQEIIGRHFSVFYPEEEVRAGKCEYELAEAAREGRFEDEGWRVRKDGGQFWANVIITAIRDAGGRLLGFAKVTRDLTERRRAQEQEAARLAAEHASRAKDTFLAMLGHELRNPLAPIATALALMKLRRNAPISREQQVIERQVKHMINLVDDLLDVSRITAGKIQLHKQRVDLKTILSKAVEIGSVLLEQRSHQLDIGFPEREITVEVDEARMIQVVANLLTNAAKYTDPGGHVRLESRLADGEVVIEVTDDGIGIEADLLPTIFELFVQGNQGVERPIGGLGLGLTLVRKLVELHGGSVEGYSAGIGAGSRFTVRLPLAASEAVALQRDSWPSPKEPLSHPRRILLVDDNEDALLLVAHFLSAIGHEVKIAADAAVALGVVREFKPEIAILDIGLPVVDGYELAEQLRAELAPAVPRFIALTGYGQERDRARSREAGFAAHLVKPVDMRTLVESIESPT